MIVLFPQWPSDGLSWNFLLYGALCRVYVLFGVRVNPGTWPALGVWVCETSETPESWRPRWRLTLQCRPIIHLDFHTLKICAFVSQYLHQGIPTYPGNRIINIQAQVLSHLWVRHSLLGSHSPRCMLGKPEVLTQQLSIWGHLLLQSVRGSDTLQCSLFPV